MMKHYSGVSQQVGEWQREATELHSQNERSRIISWVTETVGEDVGKLRGDGPIYLGKAGDQAPIQIGKRDLEEGLLSGQIDGQHLLWRHNLKEQWTPIGDLMPRSMKALSTPEWRNAPDLPTSAFESQEDHQPVERQRERA